MATPKLRPYNIAGIQRVRDRIVEDQDAVSLLGERIEKEHYQLLVRRFREYCKEASRAQLQDSLIDLLGQDLTKPMLRAAAWRVAGNRHRFRLGLTVPPWERQRTKEWVPLQCLSTSRFYPFQQGKPSVMTRWRILAGRPCPLIIQKRWPLRFCNLVAKDVGFSRRNPLYIFRDFRELVGLRLYALLDPERSSHLPGFDQIKCPPSCKEYNRQLILLRTRAPSSKFECPEGYSHACFRCQIGYEHCEAATHRRTYTLERCPKCEQETWFDPDSDVGICVECNERSFG